VKKPLSKIARPSWVRQLELFPPADPKPPCARVLEFCKRSTTVTVRMPDELELELRRRAQGLHFTRSHMCLRILAEYCDDGQGMQRISGTRRIA